MNEVRYYPRSTLDLETDVEGAKMWAVGLEQTMLTYFGVEPHSRFETHAHVSEQITLVLTGVLYFQVDDDVFAVAAGEVIALPSNVPHSAYTLDEAVVAVDAWSPLPEKYAG